MRAATAEASEKELRTVDGMREPRNGTQQRKGPYLKRTTCRGSQHAGGQLGGMKCKLVAHCDVSGSTKLVSAGTRSTSKATLSQNTIQIN